MASISIAGSADGLGQLSAKALIAEGQRVVLHARNEQRGAEALRDAPGAEGVVTADLTSIDDTNHLAENLNTLGSFDAIIRYAAVNAAPGNEIFTVQVLAPYILTCLIQKPKRLIYLSSDMHKGGSSKLESIRSDISRIT